MHMRGRQLKTIFVPKLSIYALLYRLTLSEIYPLVFPLQVLHGGIPFIARLSRFNCLHGFTSEAFKTFLVMGALSTPAFLYAPAYVILKGFLLSLSVPYQRHFRVFFIAFSLFPLICDTHEGRRRAYPSLMFYLTESSRSTDNAYVSAAFLFPCVVWHQRRKLCLQGEMENEGHER